jgi:signal transduction histidine kinase
MRLASAKTAVETAAYRIAQEAVTNAVRHSQAARTSISVVFNDASTTHWSAAVPGLS